MPSAKELASLYQQAHNAMRNIDGLQPQDAFDELLKFLFYKQLDHNHSFQARKRDPSSTYMLSESTDDTAARIRNIFSNYLELSNSWSQLIWREAAFHLSDTTLLTLERIFHGTDFAELDIDIRSAALRTFLTPALRKGLGIFLTPDSVVRMMVEVVDPKPTEAVYDPACGSGTFLVEVVKRWLRQNGAQDFDVWGTDKSPRMLLLSELNLGHFNRVNFHRKPLDALATNAEEHWPKPNSFDVILTNPPFGVILRGDAIDLSRFVSCRSSRGEVTSKQHSDVVFLEQSLRFLKPGGRLGIVLPRSIITNSSFAQARKAIEKLGHVYAVVSLPQETFHITGTQTTTLVLFMKKLRKEERTDEPVRIVLSEVTNVGFDSTGRPRAGNQLPELGTAIHQVLSGNMSEKSYCHLLREIPRDKTLSSLDKLLFRPTSRGPASSKTAPLKEAIAFARTGKTPPRSSYRAEGLFLLKVGNLTGKGIDWMPRKRNFVADKEAAKRRGNSDLMLQPNDIVLTSSAHSPKYIAKKVDIVSLIPEPVGGEASFVGELMLLRPDPEAIDPFVLLAYLRSPTARQQIQRMIRGQTAHLYPDDLIELELPLILFNPDEKLSGLANLLRAESRIAVEKSQVGFDQERIIEEIFT